MSASPLDIELVRIEKLIYAGYLFDAAKELVSLQLFQYGVYDAEILELQRIARKTHRMSAADRAPFLLKIIHHLRKDLLMSKKVFIVHGWDTELKLDAKNYLQSILHLDPVILHEQDGRGDVIINKFEQYAAQCQAGIILFSDRDGAPGDTFGDPNALRQPRPNVLFEMGYFFSRLGRAKVLLLKRGNVEINSDILGIEYIDVSSGVSAAGELIRQRLSWLLS